MLAGLHDDWVTADYGQGTFSPRDVVAHMLHGERTDWATRIRIVLEKGKTRAFDPFDRFAFRETLKTRSCGELLAEFAEVRDANLGWVAGLRLADEALDRGGMHPELGPVTLRQLFAAWVVHDLSHIAQIARAMAHQYGEAIGPWRAYMPIVQAVDSLSDSS
jgi:hypothetical protein